jgi:DNA-binding HxlR family transcriptional regulator
MPRRSYDHYCPLSRALDVIGERWTLLIVRELLAGPRRYTDLHADLPGVSTDVLAARLKELEHDGLVTRRRLPPPASATVYELTPRGEGLLPALTALADWGAAELPPEPGPTDALRAHWFALPLIRALAKLAPQDTGLEGAVNVRTGDATFHVLLSGPGPRYGHGPAEHPLAQLTLSAEACLAVARDTATLPELVSGGQAGVDGEGQLAAALRGERQATGK